MRKKRGKAYAAALRLLTLRSRTVRELEGKLRERGYPAEEIVETIEHFLRLGYLDDELFARQWAESAAAYKGLGPLRIEAELRKRGIDRAAARRAAEGAFVQEGGQAAAAREALARKIGRGSLPMRGSGEQRLISYLTRRGFGRGTALAVLKTYRSQMSGCPDPENGPTTGG